jgi:pimeloyl-ACP methyl ester carboxylesterase
MRLRESLKIARLLVTPSPWIRPRRTQRPQVDISPWQEKRVSARQGSEHLYLEIAGPTDDAPVMLMLPGGMVDHRIWVNTADLARHFRLIAFDYPEQSPHYRGVFEGFGDVVLDFVQSLKLREMHVAGVSAGALVALDLATRLRAEVEVRGLTLVSANLMSIDEDEIRTRARLSTLGLSISGERLRAIIERIADSSASHAEVSRFQQRDFFYVRSAEYYQELFSWMKSRGRQKQETEHVHCPTLVLHGTADHILPIRVARATASHLPNAKPVEIHEFEGFGHEMVFSHGPDIVAVMRDFMIRNQLIIL